MPSKPQAQTPLYQIKEEIIVLITTLCMATAAAAKWLIAAKVMTAVGTGCLVAAPAVERMKK